MRMRIELIFPYLLIAFNIGAAIIYAVRGDIRKAVYFASAAVLNITVI